MVFMPTDTLSVALDCLDAHPTWFIFPIKRLEKYPPCFPDNLRLASCNPEQIRKWHAMFPGCNWGVAHKKSKLITVDVDRKPGKVGGATLDALELEHGPLPETFVVNTPTGGLHIYFNEANGVVHQMRLNAFGPHVDSPNYTLLPGCWLSTNADQGYDIANDVPVADAPAWFIDYLGERAVAPSDQTPVVRQDTREITQRAIFYLQHDAKPSIQYKNGEFRLLMTAAALKDMGVSKEAAINLLAKYYNVPGKCEPLFSLGDGPVADRLDVKVGNAWEYLKNTAPGALSPQIEFGGSNEVDDDSIKIMLDVWKTHPGRQSIAAAAAVKAFEADTLDDEEIDAMVEPGIPEPKDEPGIPEPPGDNEAIAAEPAPEPPQTLPLPAITAINWEKKPSGIIEACRRWVYVIGIERFVNRRNPAQQWKVSQFDAAFGNFAPDKPSVSKELFKQGSYLRQFDYLAFHPGGSETSVSNYGTEYNVWRPSGIIPEAGDTSCWREHINYLFQDENYAKQVLDWMAYILQNPGKKPNHALLMVGRNTGTGKSLVACILEQLIGVRNTQRPKSSSMGGDFNSWLKDCRLCILEEVYQPGRIERLVSMRDLITETRVEVNIKGIPAFTIDNYVAILAISNHPDSLPLDKFDRRWLVVETFAMRRDRAYYEPLFRLARGEDREGLSAIYAELLARDLTGYSGLDAAPETAARTQMIELSRDDAETWLIENAGNMPLARNVVHVNDIIDAMPATIQRAHSKRLRSATIPSFLKDALQGIKYPKQIRLSNSQQVYLWVLHGQYNRLKSLAENSAPPIPFDNVVRAAYENERKKERAEIDAAARADFEEGYEE